MQAPDTTNILSLLDSYILDNPDDIAAGIAADFRRRRIERNLTRAQVAEKAGIPLSTLSRFEQKGLVSLHNLISIAIVLGYIPEIRNIFSQPKYSTTEELLQIRRNAKKKKAHSK